MLINLFLVEDDKTFCKIMFNALKLNENYNITCFDNGTDCLKNLQQNPDVVVIDFNLPDITGLELMDKINSYNPDIKNVIISGQKEVKVVVEAYRNGADNYIIKNENCIPELVNAIKNLSMNISLKLEVKILMKKVKGESC